MGKYFTIDELTYSYVAEKNNIDNTPSDEIIHHLNEMISVLDDIRSAWGHPITISSGYRCEVLNAKVGGVKTSAHLQGYAVDMQASNSSVDDFYKFVCNYLKDKNIPFDQCIIETSGKTKWVHFGLKNLSGLQRCQFFALDA